MRHDFLKNSWNIMDIQREKKSNSSVLKMLLKHAIVRFWSEILLLFCWMWHNQINGTQSQWQTLVTQFCRLHETIERRWRCLRLWDFTGRSICKDISICKNVKVTLETIWVKTKKFKRTDKNQGTWGFKIFLINLYRNQFTWQL